jgi:tripartite-type tricarboxylate transporter receptor subunit TctC
MKNQNTKIGIICILAFCAGFFFPGFSNPAFGQFPSKPINLIVGWAAGGMTDLTWRALAEPMAKSLGQPIVIANKPGGTGSLGAVLVKNAAPDGYTVGHISTSAHVINPYTFDAGYNVKDFTYICTVTALPNFLIVKADAPWKTYKEFNQYIKDNPMKVRIGYTGPTGPSPVAMKWVAKKEGLKFKEIITKGDAPGLPQLLGGHIDAFCSAASLIPHVKSGELRVLMLLNSYRLKGFEDVPTFKEIYGKIIDSVIALAGPKDLPPDVVAKFEEAVGKSKSDANFLKLIDSMSTPIINMNSKEFTAFIMETDKITKEWLDELGMTKQ